jgi:hypothetical protein
MIWHILALISVVLMSSGTPTGEHPTEGMVTEPIEFMFKNGDVQKYYGMHPSQFEYIEPYLNEAWRREPIQLNTIDDSKTFLQLKELWEQETSDGLPDISANKFFPFLKAADFLGIRGDAYRRFTRNMARKGLLGTYSQDILACMDEVLRGREIYWDLFLAFAAGLECEVQFSDQAVILCSTGSRYGAILETKPEIKINELRIAPDVFSRNKNVGTHTPHFFARFFQRLGLHKLSRSKNAGTHIAHSFVWFLWHLDSHELNLSGCKMDENDVDALSQALSKAGDVGLQAMNISECSMPPGSLAIILPHLEDLTKLNAEGNSLNEADRDALAECTKLIELNASSCFKDSPGNLAAILPHLEDLTKLYAEKNSLNEEDCGALAKCTLLTELGIRYCFERSPGSIARILPHLNDLTKLDASHNSLNEADCGALAASTLLTELDVTNCFEDSPGNIARILLHLKYLTKLDASWNILNEADCDALAASTLLTELNIRSCFGGSPGSIARILPHLEYLTKLYNSWNSLNEADREAIRAAKERGIEVHG